MRVSDNESGPSRPPMAPLPPLRKYAVVREKRGSWSKERGDTELETIEVIAHSVSATESGSLSFVTYFVYQGEALPGVTRVFRDYVDVELIATATEDAGDSGLIV